MSEENATPRDVLEAVLVHCWESALRRTPIGVDDNFFALGGHSLAAMRVAGKVRQGLGLPFDYGMVLEHHTIAELARALRDGDVAAAEWDRAGHAYLRANGLAA